MKIIAYISVVLFFIILQTDHISHVRLEIEAHWRAEDVVVGLHELLFVSVGLQVLCGIFNGLETAMFGSLHIKLG